jgi:hypothetical protein
MRCLYCATHGSLDRTLLARCWRCRIRPEHGVLVAFVSATLLPLGSEPAVFGLVKINPALFWPAILVATAGNTLGGAV